MLEEAGRIGEALRVTLAVPEEAGRIGEALRVTLAVPEEAGRIGEALRVILAVPEVVVMFHGVNGGGVVVVDGSFRLRNTPHRQSQILSGIRLGNFYIHSLSRISNPSPRDLLLLLKSLISNTFHHTTGWMAKLPPSWFLVGLVFLLLSSSYS